MTQYAFEDADNDSKLRWGGRLLAASISDVKDTVLGDVAGRLRYGPGWQTFFIRQGKQIVGIVNSHKPFYMATQAEIIDPLTARRLREETRLLEHLAIDSTHRRRGMAKALLEEALKRHRNERPKPQLWFGFVDNQELPQAMPFYASQGWTFESDPAQLPSPLTVIQFAGNVRTGQWIWRHI